MFLFQRCNLTSEETGDSAKWRKEIAQIVKEKNYPNITYIDGLDALGDMSLISADYVHPNIYGIATILENVLKVMKETL